MKKVILADIGNTAIKFATGGSEVVPLCAIPNGDWTETPQIPDCDELRICSVVPNISNKIRNMFEGTNLTKVLFAGNELRIPLKNHTKLPNQVGIDRLVASFAANTLTKSDVIVLSCGTAFVFNIVCNGEFMGGNIIPGPVLMAQSLSDNTAKIVIDSFEFSSIEDGILGTTTKECVEKGVSRAIWATTESLISQYCRILDNPTVFAFGGWSKWLAQSVNTKIELKGNLVHLGLNLLSEKK